MKLRTLKDIVQVKQAPYKDKTKGGILLGSFRRPKYIGEVVCLGPDVDIDIKVGDSIIYAPNGITRVSHEDEMLFNTPQAGILAVINTPFDEEDPNYDLTMIAPNVLLKAVKRPPKITSSIIEIPKFEGEGEYVGGIGDVATTNSKSHGFKVGDRVWHQSPVIAPMGTMDNLRYYITSEKNFTGIDTSDNPVYAEWSE